jgi:hypothetical protein
MKNHKVCSWQPYIWAMDKILPKSDIKNQKYEVHVTYRAFNYRVNSANGRTCRHYLPTLVQRLQCALFLFLQPFQVLIYPLPFDISVTKYLTKGRNWGLNWPLYFVSWHAWLLTLKSNSKAQQNPPSIFHLGYRLSSKWKIFGQRKIHYFHNTT